MLVKEIKYERKCWWCGSFADTREHKIKQTDVSSIYGKGDLRKSPDSPVLIRNGKYKDKDIIPIQSSKSDFLKYDYNICEDCNTNKSRPFDIDYDIFSKYIFDNIEELITTSILDFRKIFSEVDYLEHKKNVLKYYIKRACCEISRPNKAGYCYEISNELILFLNNLGDLQHINFEFQIKLPLLFAQKYIEGYKHICFKQMSCYVENPLDGFRDAHYITSGFTYRWFSVNHIYSYNVHEYFFKGYKEYYEGPILKLDVIGFNNIPSMKEFSNNIEIIEALEKCDIEIDDDEFGSSYHKRLLNQNQFETFAFWKEYENIVSIKRSMNMT